MFDLLRLPLMLVLVVPEVKVSALHLLTRPLLLQYLYWLLALLQRSQNRNHTLIWPEVVRLTHCMTQFTLLLLARRYHLNDWQRELIITFAWLHLTLVSCKIKVCIWLGLMFDPLGHLSVHHFRLILGLVDWTWIQRELLLQRWNVDVARDAIVLIHWVVAYLQVLDLLIEQLGFIHGFRFKLYSFAQFLTVDLDSLW